MQLGAPHAPTASRASGGPARRRHTILQEPRAHSRLTHGGRGQGAHRLIRYIVCSSILLLPVGGAAPGNTAPTLGNLQPAGMSGTGQLDGIDEVEATGLPRPAPPQRPSAQVEITVPGHYINFKEVIDKCDPVGELGTIVLQQGEHRWENFLEIGQVLTVRGGSNAALPVWLRRLAPRLHVATSKS